MAADQQKAHPATQMPVWIPRVIVLVIVFVIVAIAAVNVFVQLRSLIVWLVISLFLSFALEPGVNWLEAHGWRRGLATAVVLFGLVLLGAVLLATMIPLVVEQIRDLIRNVPIWLDEVSVYTERWFDVSLSTDRVLTQLGEADAEVGSFAGNIAGNLFGFGAALVAGIFQALTIALFTFYLVADGPRVRRAVCSLFRPERQQEVLRAWEVGVEKTGGYFYSRTLLGVISGVLVYVLLRILGIPFAAALALWMGVVSQFIPVIGTYLASSLPLLVALLEDPRSAIVVLVYIVVYQQIENYLLSPRITARTMQLHPAVAFGSVIAGGSLLGPIGAFLALPAAAIIQASLSTYVTFHEVMDTTLTPRERPVTE